MSVNRFDQSVATTTPYTSLYAPVPLQALTDLARDHQNRFRSALDDINATRGLLDIKADPRNAAYGNNYIASVNNKLTDLTGRIVKEGYTPELQNEWFRTKNAIVSDPSRLALQNAYSNHQIYQKDLVDQKGKGTYLKDMDDYTGDGDPNQVTPYNYKGLESLLDYDKSAKDIVGKIAADGSMKDSVSLDSNGNIISIKKGSEGVVAKKLKGLSETKADQFLLTPEGRQYATRISRFNPNVDIKKAAADFLYRSNAEQIGLKSEFGSDFQYAPSDIREKQDLLNSLQGQTLEGSTYNAIDNDTQYKTLENDGIFEKQKDGTVKINYKGLYEEKPVISYRTSMSAYNDAPIPVYGTPKQAMTKQVELANQMQKMAKVTGFNGEVSTKNYDLITSAYNTLSKARLFGEQLSTPVSNLESNKAERNWNLSTFVNPENTNNLTTPPELKKGDKIVINERQTTSDGKMIKKGYILGEDNVRTPIAMKPNSIEDGGFFDSISKIGVESAKYQTGQTNATNNTTSDGKHIVTSNILPGVGSVHVIENDPKDKANLSYVFIPDPNLNKEPVRYNNYSDFQRALEMEYYNSTKEGKSDVAELLKQDKQAKLFN